VTQQVPWLAQAARMTDFPVVEVDGWRGRGHGGMDTLEGVVLHHTAGPATGDYPSLRVVRGGRPGLAGPLAQLGLARSGTIFVIAAGLSYHAGASAWAGFTGLNRRFLGVEAESTGRGDWTPAQLDAYPRLVAALLHYMRRPAGRAAAHREVARPPGRKIDPVGIDMPAFRARVAEMLADPTRRIPRLTEQKENTVADAQEIAEAVWNHPVRNTFGDVVQARQVLVAAEQRVADVQARLAALEQRLTPTDNP